MPFKSDAQRGYLFKFHPEIARRWAKEEKSMARSYFKNEPKKKAKKKGKRITEDDPRWDPYSMGNKRAAGVSGYRKSKDGSRPD